MSTKRGRPPKVEVDLSNIRQQPDGRWRVDVARSLPDGQRFRRSSAFREQEDAITFRDKAVAEYKAVCEGARLIVDGGYTVETWCDHCLTAIMPTQANKRGKPYAPRTLEVYGSVLKTSVYPHIGHVRLSALSPEHLDQLMPKVASAANKANVKKVLSRILTLAEDRGKRPRGTNPCEAINLPSTRRQRTEGKVIVTTEVDPEDRRKKKVTETAVPDGLIIEKVRVLSFDEEAKLLEHVRAHPEHSNYETLILLSLRLGLRIGEALAVDWDAVDFERNTITIEQQAQREKGKGLVVRDTKSVAGDRVLPMPKSLADHLKDVSARRLVEGDRCPHIIHNRKCQRRDPSRVHNRIKQLTEGAGLGDRVEGRRFIPRPSYHDLRRTCLTRLATGHVAPGVKVEPVPPTVLIKISGHEEVKVLLSYYTNADDGMVVEAMGRMP